VRAIVSRRVPSTPSCDLVTGRSDERTTPRPRRGIGGLVAVDVRRPRGRRSRGNGTDTDDALSMA
jgi:hypothetical protein